MTEKEVRHVMCAIADLDGVLAYNEEFNATSLSTNDTPDVEQQKVSVRIMSCNVYRVARVALCWLTHAICTLHKLKFELILFKSTVKLDVLYFKVIVLSNRSLGDDRAVFFQVDFHRL